jgi:hypothetical protein
LLNWLSDTGGLQGILFLLCSSLVKLLADTDLKNFLVNSVFKTNLTYRSGLCCLKKNEERIAMKEGMALIEEELNLIRYLKLQLKTREIHKVVTTKEERATIKTSGRLNIHEAVSKALK